MSGLYELNDIGKRPRRQGLNKHYTYSLHGPRSSSDQNQLAMEHRQTRNSTTLIQKSQPPPKTKPTPRSQKKPRVGKLTALPKSSPPATQAEVESSDEEAYKSRNDIKPTTFSSKTSKKTDPKSSSNIGLRRSSRGRIEEPTSSQESAKRKDNPAKFDIFGKPTATKKHKPGFGKEAELRAKVRERIPRSSDGHISPIKELKSFKANSQSDQENSPPAVLRKLPAFSDDNDDSADEKSSFKKPAGLEDDLFSPVKGIELRRIVADLPSDSQSPVKHRTFIKPHTDDDLLWGETQPGGDASSPGEAPYRNFGKGLDLNIALGATQADLDRLIASAAEELVEEEEQQEEKLPPNQRRCPMCKQPLDISEFEDQGLMNTRQQERFCRSHQQKSAQADWESKGYPNINWSELDHRLSKHHAFVRSLINGAPCHQRSILDEKVKAGKERNLLKSTENLIPGYYGSRGLRVISENIMAAFTPLLKKRAIKDRLIAARGPTAFVQSVCVLEVATRLVEEDMGVDAERARELLKESAGLGELVNEEEREVVVEREESDEEDEEMEESDEDVY